MIRDFWKIQKNRLIDEVNSLQSTIDDQTGQAIDAVRKIGNIGAHMEKDIDVLIAVAPDEADLLLRLIEELLEECYMQRHERVERMHKILEVAQAQKVEQAQGPMSASRANQSTSDD